MLYFAGFASPETTFPQQYLIIQSLRTFAKNYRIIFHSNDASSVGSIICLNTTKTKTKAQEYKEESNGYRFQTISGVCNRYIFALLFIDLTIM